MNITNIMNYVMAGHWFAFGLILIAAVGIVVGVVESFFSDIKFSHGAGPSVVYPSIFFMVVFSIALLLIASVRIEDMHPNFIAKQAELIQQNPQYAHALQERLAAYPDQPIKYAWQYNDAADAASSDVLLSSLPLNNPIRHPEQAK